MNKIINLILAGLTGVLVGVAGTYLVMTSYARGDQLPKTSATNNSYKELKLDNTLSTGTPVESKVFETGGFGEDRGKGTFELASESGSTADGVIPIIYANDTIITQLGVEVADFNGALLTFVYLDGKEVATEQWGNSSSSVNISVDNGGLKVGVHTIQLVQYAENSTNLNPVIVRSQQYEVK